MASNSHPADLKKHGRPLLSRLSRGFQRLLERNSSAHTPEDAAQSQRAIYEHNPLANLDGLVCEHYKVMVDNRYWTWKECDERGRGQCAYCRVLRDALGGTCYCRLAGDISKATSRPHPCHNLGRSRSHNLYEVSWACNPTHHLIDIRFIPHRSAALNSDGNPAGRHIQLHSHPDAQMTHEWPEEIHEDPTSPETAAMYQAWISRCIDEHPDCVAPDSSVGPQRILDLRGDSPPAEHGLKLREIGGCAPGPYVALSYCWGGVKPLMTTQASRHQHETAIAFGNLPQTYKDAVWLVRTLGIEYLWIDSLCITQDDQEEWQSESARMGMIYSNAYFVLVAASAGNVHAGFLRRRTGSKWIDSSNRQFGSGGGVAVIQSRLNPHQGGAFPCSQGIYRDACNNMPVQQRAWCFQERFLARRSLIFRQEEAIWECREGCICECGNGVTANRRGYMPMLLATGSYSVAPFTGSRYDAEEFLELSGGALRYIWYPCLEEYCRRALSVATDRLPAIAAVAAIVQSAEPRDQYLAGLWRSHLLPGLCWYAVPSESSLPVDYVAPSWSWASVSGAVEHTTMLNWPPVIVADEDARVVDAWCQPSVEHGLGTVRDGALVLSAFSCEARLEYTNMYDLTLGKDTYRFPVKGRYGFFKFDPHLASLAHPYLPGGRILQRHPQLQSRNERDWKGSGGSIRLLRLCDDFWLILTHAQRDSSVFERIGIIETRYAKLAGKYEVEKRLRELSVRSDITIV